MRLSLSRKTKRKLMATKKDLETLIDDLKEQLNKEYEAGVKSGHAAALDNVDALIEEKQKQNDHIAVAVLAWAKDRI